MWLIAALVASLLYLTGCSDRGAAQRKPQKGSLPAARAEEKIGGIAPFRPYFADAPRVQWTRNLLGDSAAIGDYVWQTTDGGFLVAGQTGIGLGYRLWLTKTTSSGDVVWRRILGDTLHQPTEAFAAQQTADGGYIVGANGDLTAQDVARDRADIWLVKLDRAGKTVRQNEISSDSYPVAYVQGHALVQTSDGGYVLTANVTLSDSALILFKIDGLGKHQWTKRFPLRVDCGTYDMFPLSQTMDGGYIIGTRALLKVDSGGNQQWLRTFNEVECVNSVIQTPDGGYCATGPMSDRENAYLLKVRADGSPEWILPRLTGDTKSNGNWLEQTPDGSFVVAGSYIGPGKRDVACVSRFTSSGVHIWTDSLLPGAATCVRQTRDGGYIVTGTSYIPTPTPYGTHRMFLAKLAPERRR